MEPLEAESEVAVAPDIAAKIDLMATQFADALAATEPRGQDYGRRLRQIDEIAAREMRAASDASLRLLDRPTRAASEVRDERAPIPRGMLELRRAAQRLLRDPDARPEVEAVVAELRERGEALSRDNAVIERERVVLWSQVVSLRQYAYMVERIEEAVIARADALSASNLARAEALRQDMLFAVRQRRQEILTQLAVALQGYAAIGVVQANNRELIRAISLATTTTIAALRTAVIAADAEQAWNGVMTALDEIDSYQRRAQEALRATTDRLAERVKRTQSASSKPFLRS